MATVTLKGNNINTLGNLPEVGTKAPDFKLTKTDLLDVTLKDYEGSKLILNIFHSIDTGTCAQSVRQFNIDVTEIENTKVLCISRDLPFAHSRFCGAEGIKNIEMLSEMRDNQFGLDYGILYIDGPIQGLIARSIVVIDEKGKVLHTEQVQEVVEEPNYKAALHALLDE